MVWRLLLQRALVGARFGACAALGLWLGDVLVLARSAGAAARGEWVTAMGAALLVALTTAIVAGAVTGPLLVPLFERAANATRDAWRARRDDPVRASNALAARMIAALALLGVLGAIAYQVVVAMELNIARADFLALALTLSHLACAVVFIVSWSASVRGALVVVEALGRRVRFFARPWRSPIALGAIGLVAGAAIAIVRRAELLAVPWLEGLAWLGIAAGLAAAVLTRGRARFVAAVAAIGILAGAAAGLRVRPEATLVRRLAFDRAWSGRVGFLAWTAAFDFDRDGQISMLGGGDCSPLNPRIRTGAIDIPGNGIDEDCDGADLVAISLRPRPRQQVGQDALPGRRTFIFVTIDGLAAKRLGALGRSPALLPNIDAFAAKSALFTRAFSQGPSTRLSFPSMFTSRYDSQMARGVSTKPPFPLATSEKLIQEVFDDEGYESIAIVPHALFSPQKWPSLTRGFQRVDATTLSAEKHNSAQVTDTALRILDEPRSRPLYMWIHYYDAHSPYAPVPGIPTPDTSQESLYDGELALIDRELGRLFAAIEAREERPFVVLTADHGTVFVPGRRHHYGYDLYTATTHVPLLVYGPGIPASQIDTLVSTIDVLPTMTDLLQLGEPKNMEGTSLAPEILVEQRPDRIIFEELYLEERERRGEDPLRMVSVRNDRYNLVLDRLDARYELYDWKADYMEEHDLYAVDSRAPEPARLRSMLAAFVQQVHKRAPVPGQTDEALR